MQKAVTWAVLALGMAVAASAADIQGVLVPWECAQRMAQNGRQKVLKQEHSCSLANHYDRAAYGLLAGDNKYYRLDGDGAKWARILLKDTPDKDNLFVVVRGDVQGNAIDVKGMTEL